MFALTADESSDAKKRVMQHNFDGYYSFIHSEHVAEILEAIFNR